MVAISKLPRRARQAVRPTRTELIHKHFSCTKAMVACLGALSSLEDSSTELVASPVCVNQLDTLKQCAASFDRVLWQGTTPWRRVTFLVDEYDRDLVEVLEYESPPAHAWSDLYWSTQERIKFIANARQDAAKFASRYPGRIRRLEAAFHACGVEDKYQLNVATLEARKMDMRVYVLWAQSSGRGLEDSVTPAFSHERRQVLHNILQYSAFLTSYAKANGMCVVYVGEVLRRYSEGQTRRSREFACKLAIADELDV